MCTAAADREGWRQDIEALLRKGESEFILLKTSIYRGNRYLKFDWCIEERRNRCTGN